MSRPALTRRLDRLAPRSVARAAAPALLLSLVGAGCADQTPTGLRVRTSAPLGELSAATLPAGRYLVALEAGATVGDDVLAAAGAQVVGRVPGLNVVEVDAARPEALTTAGVRYVEPSYGFTLDYQEGDPVTAAEAGAAESTQPAAGNVGAAGPDASTAPWYASGVQWDMRAMKLDGALWRESRGGADANVCIIDSGIDSQHQELVGKVAAETSFVSTATVPSPAPLDSNGHGTHVGATVTSNGVVAAGVAPAARLMTAKVFAATGGTSITRVANALVWCTDRGAHAINMSLNGILYYPAGTDVNTIPSYRVYADAVAYATSAGVVVVNSGGNNNLRVPNPAQRSLPAQVPGNIAVGATGPLSRVGQWDVAGVRRTLPLAPPAWDPTSPEQVMQGVDGKAFYSNFGTGITVFAPGGRGGVPSGYKYRIIPDRSGTRVQQSGSVHDNIWAACSRYATYTGSENVGGVPGAGAVCRTAASATRYASLAGTSMAAPHVAGLAALLYGELGGVRSPANRTKVVGCITGTTDVIGPSTTFGGGRVNAASALACVRR